MSMVIDLVVVVASKERDSHALSLTAVLQLVEIPHDTSHGTLQWRKVGNKHGCQL